MKFGAQTIRLFGGGGRLSTALGGDRSILLSYRRIFLSCPDKGAGGLFDYSRYCPINQGAYCSSFVDIASLLWELTPLLWELAAPLWELAALLWELTALLWELALWGWVRPSCRLRTARGSCSRGLRGTERPHGAWNSWRSGSPHSGGRHSERGA